MNVNFKWISESVYTLKGVLQISHSVLIAKTVITQIYKMSSLNNMNMKLKNYRNLIFLFIFMSQEIFYKY